jgi:hypothetical protein
MSRGLRFLTKSKRRLTVFGALVVALATTVAAIAYFTAHGSGTATASVATVQNVTISGGTASTALFPASTADVALTISNPNTFAVHIGSLQLDTTQGTGGFDVDSGHAGCAVSVLGFTTQTNGGSGWTVPAKVGATNGTLSLDLANAVSMSGSAANACQGASFTVYVKAGP